MSKVSVLFACIIICLSFSLSAASFWKLGKTHKYPKSRIPAHKFAESINCVDDGFDMETYLTNQAQWIDKLLKNRTSDNTNTSADPAQYPRFMYQMPRFMFNPIMQPLLNVLPKYQKDIKYRKIARYVFGMGHSFATIGEGYGKRCDYLTADTTSTDYDPNGCFPFQNQILKYRKLDQCLSTNFPNNPNGYWMNRPGPEREFGKYHNTPSERIMYRMAILGTKESMLWDVDELTKIKHRANIRYIDEDEKNRTMTGMLSESFDDEEITDGAISKVLGCLEEAQVLRDDFKCHPVLFGSPGFVGLTLMDHHEHGHPNRTLSHACPVPPTCMRLAMERLHHFQGTLFDNFLATGLVKTARSSKGRSWVMVDGEIKSKTCNLKSKAFGKTICWNYSKCLRTMMKQICLEHKQCCPQPEVHDICKNDLRHKHCRVCYPVGGKSRWPPTLKSESSGDATDSDDFTDEDFVSEVE